jgi:pimeloyl-ACP methyl ester carboxylesterase
MDVAPTSNSNGETVLLLHGKNMGGDYWNSTIKKAAGSGYRVIVPDQVGWGKSSKPDTHYSFDLLAANTERLLDTLGIEKVNVVGHSTGGMLAVRFADNYSNRTSRLVLEDPIGLENYQEKIPHIPSLDQLFQAELTNTNPKNIHDFFAHYFVNPSETLVRPLADLATRVTLNPQYSQWARASARAYEMIHDQPVLDEYKRLQPPTLLIVGAEDRTVPLGQYADPEVRKTMGNYPELARSAARQIPNQHGSVVIIPRAGHIPHLEKSEQFQQALLNFLRSKSPSHDRQCVCH